MPAHRDHQTPRRRPAPSPAGDETPEQAELVRTARVGQRATVLVLLAVLLLSLPHPWAAIGLLPALAGLVLAVWAAARHGRASRWGWSAWSLVAAVFALYLLGFGGLRAAYPDATDAWARCSTGANTRVAQGDCDARLQASTPAWVHGMLVGR